MAPLRATPSIDPGPSHRCSPKAEIRAALAGTGLAGAPILPASAVTGEGLAEIAAFLQFHSEREAERRR